MRGVGTGRPRVAARWLAHAVLGLILAIAGVASGTIVALEAGEPMTGRVVRVIDGDTIAVRIDKKVLTVRYIGITTRVATAIEMRAVAEPFIRRRAVRHLEKGRVVVFAAGTGNPYFTTDTAAALRAMEMKADVILKGTKVDGVYTADPMIHHDATKYEEISYLKVLEQGLRVMDATAISLCMDNKLPIVVFNLRTAGNLRRVIMGEPVGTTVRAS